MTKILVILLATLTLFGCSSKGAMTSEQKYSLVSEYTQQKTFEISCEMGCTVSYKDPRDQLQLPSETNGWDVANSLIQTTGAIVTTAVPYAAIGVIATEGFKSSGDNITDSYNRSSTSVDSSTKLNNSYNPADNSTKLYDSYNPTDNSTELYDPISAAE